MTEGVLRERTVTRDRTLIQLAAMLFGGVFLLVAIAGFIPGITTDYDRLTTFGDVGAKLLGVFGINWVENIVHLLYAVLGFAAARTFAASRLYFIGGGIVYLVIWIYGLVIDLESNANFIGVNTAANWLHFVLGVALILVGVVLANRDRLGQRAARA